ncbi:MAG: glycosyltransferase, partial [Bifidobacterium minimum]|nr:glycosyltransferase [Bifidobacterium minimum]
MSSDTDMANPRESATKDAPIERLAMVVVTYKRQELLSTLLDSIERLTVPVWRIVIVDNENSPETERMVDAFRERVAELWG